MDTLIRDTYAADSKATNKNALYDPYIKAIRWASNRIGDEGVVAFVTNNGFLDGVTFDGMRKHLAEDFDAIYVLDLGGNARRGLKVSDANVFGIRVGVSINLFIKRKQDQSETTRIFYYRTDALWNKQQKFDFLSECGHAGNIEWQTIQPDARHTWLTRGIHKEFETFIPIGSQTAKGRKEAEVNAIFHTFGMGFQTSRDAWLYNFDRNALIQNVKRISDFYNMQVLKWRGIPEPSRNVDDFVEYDDTKIKWSSGLKQKLEQGKLAEGAESQLRMSLFRPFTRMNLCFDRTLNHRMSVFPTTFPSPETEKENRVICVNGIGSNKPFHTLMVGVIPDLHLTGDSRCFPFYIYNEDGTNRRENITDWALAEFRSYYGDDTLTKWDIFHYTYGLLHHLDYREKYEMNLKRDLPHIPFAEDFWGFANAGAQLADLHVNYESVPKYAKLKYAETEGMRVDWRVEKMRLSKDKTQLKYNDFLTLAGIPAEVFAYRLGTRSALEWVIDQYRVKTDKRSGIVNDPNRADEPQYIVDLIARVITVSLETVEVVNNLPPL